MAEPTNNIQQTLQNIRKQYDTSGQREAIAQKYDAQVGAVGTAESFMPANAGRKLNIASPVGAISSKRDPEMYAEARRYAESQRNAAIANINAQRAAEITALGDDNGALVKGAEFAASVLGDGLGRLGTDKDVQEGMSRLKDMSYGLDAQELQADRERAYQGINQSTQTSMRGMQAALARAGVRGGVAGSQLRDVAMGGLQQKAGVERDLFLKNADVRRQGLNTYAQAVGELKTFDLGQAAREKDIILQGAAGMANKDTALQIAKMQADAAKATAAAQAAANSGK